MNQDFAKNSCYPPGHYYSPIISVDDVRKRESEIWGKVKDGIKGIELNAEKQIGLVKELSVYYKEIPFKAGKQDKIRYQFENNAYSYTDGIILYSMMRHLKPKRIIEVGSGYSSALMLDVNELYFQNQIKLTFIEPFPERLYSLMTEKDKQDAIVIGDIVQSVPVETFEVLEEGDILFIDSTHVVKTGSDVVYILFEILPKLKSGVIIHFHDIFYPFEYPKEWVFGGFNWNEDYFLKAFLMYNNSFEIKLYSHYLHTVHPHVFAEMPLSYKNFGADLWLVKK